MLARTSKAAWEDAKKSFCKYGREQFDVSGRGVHVSTRLRGDF